MPVKSLHEIRDPIHTFIRLETAERDVLNSRPFQRLRYIHQLAATYLVYPGATHRRFEHSLGVMELATRIYDTVIRKDNIEPRIESILPDETGLLYWRRALRMAALCHDIGHLPFSHAGEKELLPDGWDHERLTSELIKSDDMRAIWNSMEPRLDPDHIAALATSKTPIADVKSRLWQLVLREIIVGDAFGADRMDFLLRDSLHAGVAYGRFDHHRLIDSLRILPEPQVDEVDEDRPPTLGLEEGGIYTAEALLLARYFMYQQVYFHHVRRAYDIHLIDFLRAWLSEGYPIDLSRHLAMTDNVVLAAMEDAAYSPEAAGHDPARRFIARDHFRLLYSRRPQDVAVNPDAGAAIFDGLRKHFTDQSHLFRHDSAPAKAALPFDFPVLLHDRSIVPASLRSPILLSPPSTAFDYVLVDRGLLDAARKWLDANISGLIIPKGEQ